MAQVYPRVCGGTRLFLARSVRRNGLSPRVRGNPNGLLEPEILRGSIPACAGEPPSLVANWCRNGVYPRVCGGTLVRHWDTLKSQGLSPRVRGTSTKLLMLFVLMGLSPRVRGNRADGEDDPRHRGSIPACAGEPRGRRRRGRCGRVYPRVCGGTSAGGTFSARIRGLSPRVRGNPPIVAEYSCGRGSIPACAGEPSLSPPRRTARRVYPRVCGGTP